MEKRDIDAPINSYLKKLGKNQGYLQIVSTIEDNYWALFRNLVFATNSDFLIPISLQHNVVAL